MSVSRKEFDLFIAALDAVVESYVSMGEDVVMDDGIENLFDEIGDQFPCENPF